MTDPFDEYAVQQLKEFSGKQLKSTTKEGLDFPVEDEKKQLPSRMHSLIHSPSTKDVLGGKSEKVVVSSRMADSVCILTTSE